MLIDTPVSAARASSRDEYERLVRLYIPDDIEFQTKQQIALDLIDRALGNGIQVAAWTFDELYGRDSKFPDVWTNESKHLWRK